LCALKRLNFRIAHLRSVRLTYLSIGDKAEGA